MRQGLNRTLKKKNLEEERKKEKKIWLEHFYWQ
jgi:hypothetical protein